MSMEDVVAVAAYASGGDARPGGTLPTVGGTNGDDGPSAAGAVRDAGTATALLAGMVAGAVGTSTIGAPVLPGFCTFAAALMAGRGRGNGIVPDGGLA
jgi:hypothetical protein